MSAPNWYDVLDVDATASTEEIRAAWRDAIADLTPADRRFRLYNQAAEVLLDPDQRAAHDAALAEETAATEPVEADPAEPADPGPAAEPARVTADAGGRRGWVPTWLLAGLAVMTALAVGLAAYLFMQPSEAAVEDATGAARAAAERAVVPVLAYDYRTLDEDQEAAHDLITSDYRAEAYDPLFEAIRDNAPQIEAVVEVEVIASAITRSGEDRVEVLLFVDRPTTNAETKQPVIYKDQVTLVMEKVGDEWLVDEIRTSPVAP